MGVLLILVGLACAGLLADLEVENHLGSAPVHMVSILGGNAQLSIPQVALLAFATGAAAVVLVGAGIVVARRRRVSRRDLRRRVADLESENAMLREEPPDTVSSGSWTA